MDNSCESNVNRPEYNINGALGIGIIDSVRVTKSKTNVPLVIRMKPLGTGRAHQVLDTMEIIMNNE